MNRLVLIIVLFFSIPVSAQFTNVFYAAPKKKYLEEQRGENRDFSNDHTKLLIEDRLYIVSKLDGEQITVSEPISGRIFKILSNRILFIDSLGVAKRRDLLIKYLKRIGKKYIATNLEQKEIDRIDYAAFAKDSIYENYYSPIREQLTKSWLIEKDPKLLSDWFKFLNKHLVDDGLDSKYLGVCFIEHPEEFAKTLNKQKVRVRKNIFNYMISSSGFRYATSALNRDYDETIDLMRRLVKN